MSSSYKPALSKALVRIARVSPMIEFELATIGEESSGSTGRRTVTFHLRQAESLTKEPKVVRAICTAAQQNGL